MQGFGRSRFEEKEKHEEKGRKKERRGGPTSPTDQVQWCEFMAKKC